MNRALQTRISLVVKPPRRSATDSAHVHDHYRRALNACGRALQAHDHYKRTSTTGARSIQAGGELSSPFNGAGVSGAEHFKQVKELGSSLRIFLDDLKKRSKTLFDTSIPGIDHS
jgi:hypothetical protein